MQVACTIARLQEGLEAVLVMGQTTVEIPKAVLRFYRGLDERLRGQPVNKLTTILSGLEQAIRNDVGQILQMAVVDDAALIAQRTPNKAGELSPADEIAQLAEDFRRRVQMSVYVRVLLRGQGADTEPMELSVPTEQIRHQIEALKIRGRRHREAMQAQVKEMLEDIGHLLANEKIPDPIQEHLLQTRAGLTANLRHLGSRASLEDMPYHMGNAVLQDSIGEAWPDRESASPTASEPSPEQNPGKPQPETTPSGFFQCLWLWCVTPSTVSWKEIRSGRYQR